MMRSRSIVFKLRPRYLKRKAAKKKPMACYQDRGERLSELGYAGYREYLSSDDWKAIRAAKLGRHANCLLCRCPASQVHHLSYADNVLLGLEPRLLVSLCDACHENIEFDGAAKLDLKAANAKLKGLASALGLNSWLRSVGWAKEKNVKMRPSVRHKKKVTPKGK